ncbi:MAG TPA: hypothetical protein VE912_20665 [Bacteroidales bacterium]|nr:hypothetical protein [Bacteroidales bacterium]
MSSNILKHFDLDWITKQPVVLEKIKSQVERDFRSFGLVLPFTAEASLSIRILHDELSGQLHQIMQSRPGILQGLYYHIDLEEKAVREIAAYAGDPAPYISELIIQREMLKVLSKIYYSGDKRFLKE